MNTPSRRRLASYAATQLIAGKPARNVARDLASVLRASGRQKELDLLVSDIAWELENRGSTSNATVTSARPLPAKLKSEIEKLIKAQTKVKSVDLQENIDSGVLGGFRVETPTRLWDKTAARALTDLKEAING